MEPRPSAGRPPEGSRASAFLLPSDPNSEATGVSGDGSVIVGASQTSDGDRAFRWTSGGGMVALGSFSCWEL